MSVKIYGVMGLAYQMSEAYNKTTTRADAIELVKNKNIETDDNILFAMWHAIDAYCDMREI